MQSMGLGGGFLMTIYIKETQTAYSLNARERAPSAASPDLYKEGPDVGKNGLFTCLILTPLFKQKKSL